MDKEEQIEDPSLPSISATVQTNELIEVPNSILEQNQISVENQIEEETSFFKRVQRWFTIYVKKFKGLHEQRPKRLPWSEYLWSFIGSFLGIVAVAFLHFRVLDK